MLCPVRGLPTFILDVSIDVRLPTSCRYTVRGVFTVFLEVSMCTFCPPSETILYERCSTVYLDFLFSSIFVIQCGPVIARVSSLEIFSFFELVAFRGFSAATWLSEE